MIRCYLKARFLDKKYKQKSDNWENIIVNNSEAFEIEVPK